MGRPADMCDFGVGTSRIFYAFFLFFSPKATDYGRLSPFYFLRFIRLICSDALNIFIFFYVKVTFFNFATTSFRRFPNSEKIPTGDRRFFVFKPHRKQLTYARGRARASLSPKRLPPVCTVVSSVSDYVPQLPPYLGASRD